MIDWGLGRYEETARELEPVAAHVVSLAQLHPGERVLDLATGTGNGALLAAQAGGEVVGLDAAPRLLSAARERFAAAGLAGEFVQGDLQALPFEDASFDVVVSVFGVIFAPDPAKAIAETVRVLREGGRAVFSVWVPAGAIDGMVGAFVRAAAARSGERPERFAWHDPAALDAVLPRNGALAHYHDGELLITAASPEEYLSETEQWHPMSVAMRPALEGVGEYKRAREQALDALRAGNEDPGAFRVRSPYRLIEIRKRA